jgi:hypothetical protein
MSKKDHIPVAPHTTRSAMVGGVRLETKFVFADPEVAPIELTEVMLWPPRQGEGGPDLPLWCDLRFGDQKITTDNWIVVVHLRRAELVANFVGCTVAPGTRFGDEALPPTELVTEKEVGETELSSTAVANAKLGAGLREGVSISGQVQADAKAQTRSKVATERKAEFMQRRVASLPNNRWEILEPRGRLKGTYLQAPALDGKDALPLCRIVPNSDGPVEATLSIEVRTPDLDADFHPREEGIKFLWKKTTRPEKTAIIKILLRKACTKRFSDQKSDRYTLARTRIRMMDHEGIGENT